MSVSLKNYMAATATVASVRAPFRHILSPVEMTAPRSSFSRAAEYLYVIYEI